MPDQTDDGPPAGNVPTFAQADADLSVIAALRAGDDTAFATLVEQYNGALQRLAYVYVKDRSVAEDVVQETWIGLLQSLGRFEGRSSLKTWLFRILMNIARSRARKESRTISFSSLGDAAAEPGDPAVDADRFHPAGSASAGHWASPPARWRDDPEAQAVSSETRARIGAAIHSLPDTQREVITLRDIEGLRSEEVCNLLQISDTNQRVLLHRARSKVRASLATYFEEGA